MRTPAGSILRDTGTGGMQVYNISNNQIIGTTSLGAVGLNWQMAGVSNHGTQSDLVLRDSGSGGLEIYNINNNAITGAAILASVGLYGQPSGFGDFSSRNEGDMLLRNVNTGGLHLYDLAGNQITGTASLDAVGLNWQLGGFAVDPPTSAMGSSDNSTAQLVQAMAGFGGGSGPADTSNALALGADTSQQPLLATPHA